MGYLDPEKRRETQRKWREANRERLRAKNREYFKKYKQGWRVRNAERSAQYDANSRKGTAAYRRAYQREYYARNKAKWAVYGERRYREHSEDIQKQSLAWKKAHPQAVAESRAKRRDALFQWWFRELLPSLSCQNCGLADRDCLDFHHRNPVSPGERKKNPTTMLYGVNARASIEAEIAKCDVLCANCHRHEHARLRRETSV